MSGNETDILNRMWEDIREVKSSIKDTQKKIEETSEKLAETASKVNQLNVWVSNINTKITTWEQTGCPAGRVNQALINNHASQILEIKDTVKDLEYSKRDAITIGATSGASSGAILGVIIQGIVAFFNK